MELHADLSQRALHDTNALAWMPSPMAGVEWCMLDRRGDEVARATSIVRYMPGSRLERPVHGGGEEILVLAGVFQDNQGTYPAGSWLRNPPGSVHRPWSEAGCTIWVKTGHLPNTQGPDGSDA
ncbi:cupin domain-containing protein [Cyanobium sp. ATX 6A2]|uniref:cupin domain-containing protein n=1 Tax=Cyanobium sp. ATX 6A2 TaxID=2823700 RepID=UPI0020CF94E2|nr:cupin domain-containing protein [Cyanobium sp. ATX 6A2]MCP9889413.1 cupin domain-containing protein [Cyanobium sp. ATX 6A2]